MTHVTVIRTLAAGRLGDSIFLTEAGRKLAVDAKARHEAVIAFLEAVGVFIRHSPC